MDVEEDKIEFEAGQQASGAGQVFGGGDIGAEGFQVSRQSAPKERLVVHDEELKPASALSVPFSMTGTAGGGSGLTNPSPR
jgi:hypothetical protein